MTTSTTTQRMPLVRYLELEPEPHLVANECTKCNAVYFDTRIACAGCENRDFQPRALATTGTLRTFSIIHRSAKGIPTPYVSAVVDLDGGGTVKANLLNAGTDPAGIRLKMPLRLTTFVAGTDDEGTEAVGFAFEPGEGASNG
ncbi:MAG TPA: OB-fold domain-containing protein [Acidimicrobiales bacterium]|nr:OB-fold domain-containing protein [Acidimicrobiales bacterium]